MAGSYAAAYGAGAASEELHRLLAERLTNQKFEEEKRQSRSREEGESADRRQRDTFAKQEADARAAREEASKQENYEDRQERSRQFNSQMQTHTDDRQVRVAERADDRETGLEGEDRQRAFTAGENQKNRDFQSYMDTRRAGRESSHADSEPLVAIKDPVTQQPRLVPRSQAVNQSPASTRDQALTEGQSNAAGFGDRMKFNETAIQAFEGSVGRGSQLEGLLPGEMQSSVFQQYQAAKKNWIAAQLRKESGAAISQGEYDEADSQYFPQPSDGPETIKQKRELRQVAAASMLRASGSAGMDAGGPPAANAAPPVGGSGGTQMTRTLRNRATGETRTQTSIDGGRTWN